jgi:hypothetical protein
MDGPVPGESVAGRFTRLPPRCSQERFLDRVVSSRRGYMPGRYGHIQALFVSDAVFAEYAPAATCRGEYRDQTNVDIDVDCVTGAGWRGVDGLRHHLSAVSWLSGVGAWFTATTSLP